MPKSTETATEEQTIVTVLEHHDADGTSLDVAVVRPDRWHFLTVEEARELAEKLLDAAETAEEHSEEFGVPLRTR
jgi:type I site-specific restriction endonuclease